MFRLSELYFEISMLSLHTVIGLSLDIISKCLNILSKPTEPKVSSVVIVNSTNLSDLTDLRSEFRETSNVSMGQTGFLLK